MNQPTSSPTSKVTAVGATGVVLTALVALANLVGISIPADVSGAVLTIAVGVTTIVNFVAGYLKKEKTAKLV